MRKLYIALFFAMFANWALGQTAYNIKYKYDNAGNRTERNVIMLKSAKNDNAQIAAAEMKSDVYQEDVLGHEIKIHPNPTKGQLRVEITNFGEKMQASIAVYTLAGKPVAVMQAFAGTNLLDISAQPQGVYIMRITIEQTSSDWKIIKQ